MNNDFSIAVPDSADTRAVLAIRVRGSGVKIRQVFDAWSERRINLYVPVEIQVTDGVALSCAGDVTAVVDGEEAQFTLGVDVGVSTTVEAKHGPARLRIDNHQTLRLAHADGRLDIFQFDALKSSWSVLRIATPVYRIRLAEKRQILLGAGGQVRVGDQELGILNAWRVTAEAVEIASAGTGLLVAENCSRTHQYYFTGNDWYELHQPRRFWHFAPVLNGEHSLSTKIYDLVELFASGAVLLWGTHTFAPGTAIDSSLVGEDGAVQLSVRRAAGLEEPLYFYEDGDPLPAGCAYFSPEHFQDRDGALHPAWLVSTSSDNEPVPFVGFSVVGTALMVLAAFLLPFAFFLGFGEQATVVALGAVGFAFLKRSLHPMLTSIIRGCQ